MSDRFTQVRLIQVYFPLSNISAYTGKKKCGPQIYITKLSSSVAGTSKAASRERLDRGHSPLMQPAGGKGRVKNKGEFSGQRRTKSDVADNETSAHDQGIVHG